MVKVNLRGYVELEGCGYVLCVNVFLVFFSLLVEIDLEIGV